MTSVYLTADCTLHGASVSVTVHEASAVKEWTQTVALDDGENEHRLGGLDGDEAHRYWIDAELDADGAIPELHSVAVVTRDQVLETRGGSFAGDADGYRLATSGENLGEQGAQLAGATKQSTVNAPPRGVGYGGNVGANYSPTATNRWGGTYGVSSESTASLLDQDGFVLVLERETGEKKVYGPDLGPNRRVISASIVEEVNTKSDWQLDVPPDSDLYEWTLADATVGYNGEQLFSGTLLSVGSQFGDSLTLSGFGPLWHATHGELAVTYPDDHPDYSGEQDIPAWRAIEHAWQRVADKTDGEVRGFVVSPNGGNQTTIPSDGQTFEGSPLAVMQRLHSYAGMAFAIDHGSRANLATSFTPGEERRSGRWQAKDYDPKIDADGYANRVIVRGAPAGENYGYERYRGVAEATQAEIDAVADGQIIERTVPAYDLTSEAACEAQAQAKLGELQGEYTITGSVEAAPVHLTPGYTYRVEEFDTAAPEIFTPVLLPLQSIEHKYGSGGAQTTLKFETTEGVERAIRQQVLPEGVSLDVIRRQLDVDAVFGSGGLDKLLNYDLDGTGT